MERKLAAILAADVVGYSSMMEADEAGTFARLMSMRTELFEPAIAAHRGRVFKLTGDGLFAEFGSVVDAVDCAVSVQQSLAERNAALPEGERTVIRVGINLGEVIVDGDDRYGEGVNIAARLEQLAEPGGTCVSAKVATEVGHKLPYRFEPMGERRVKNIAEPITVFRVVAAGAPAKRRPLLRKQGMVRIVAMLAPALLVVLGAVWFILQSAPPTVSGMPSIAVLPFTNAGGEEPFDYFSDGVTEDLISMLARAPDLSVASLSSASTYKGTAADPRAVGKALGVDYVLEGSVRKGDSKVRINAQLIDVSTGKDLWSERFDKEAADPWQLQDEVTAQIVAALTGDRGQLKLQQYRQAWGEDSSSLGEYDYYLRGHEYYMRFTPADNDRAGRIWQQGLEKFPGSSLLELKLAWVHFNRPFLFLKAPSDEEYAEAARLAQSAIERPDIAPLELRIYHWIEAYIFTQAGDCDSALRESDAAVKLAPYDIFPRGDLASIDILCGRLDRAIDTLNTAIAQDAANAPYYRNLKGWALVVKGDFPAAEAELAQAASFPTVKVLRAIAQLQMGQADRGRALLAEAMESSPGLNARSWRAANFLSDSKALDAQVADLVSMGLPQ